MSVSSDLALFTKRVMLMRTIINVVYWNYREKRHIWRKVYIQCKACNAYNKLLRFIVIVSWKKVFVFSIEKLLREKITFNRRAESS